MYKFHYIYIKLSCYTKESKHLGVKIMNKLAKDIKCFRALADPLRIKLLQVIHEQDEMCVCVLTERFKMSQSKLSYHLKLLLDAELINMYSSSKWNFYSINIKTLQRIFTPAMIDKILNNTASNS